MTATVDNQSIVLSIIFAVALLCLFFGWRDIKNGKA
jgi:hypothetical protein